MFPRCHPDPAVLINATRDGEKSLELQGETTINHRIYIHLMFRIASWGEYLSFLTRDNKANRADSEIF